MEAILLLAIVGLFLLYICSQNYQEEPFWMYSPCMYNAQNRFTCDPYLRYPWMWWSPTRYQGIYDIRGEPIWDESNFWKYIAPRHPFWRRVLQ